MASGSFRTEPSQGWASPYEKEVIAALKRSLPSHYEGILQQEDLSDKQKHTLNLLYGPAIENFVESGELDQLGRINALESLILSGDLTTEPISR